MFYLTFVSFAISCLLLGESIAEENNLSPNNDEDVYYPMLDWSDSFDWQLFKAVSSQKNKNVLISPISLKVPLALLYEAASERTRKKFQDVLHFSPTVGETRVNFQKILSSLRASGENTLDLSTRIFMDFLLRVQSNYSTVASNFYETEVTPLNFTNKIGSAEVINTWVSSATHGNIHEIVKPGDLERAVVLFYNAIYFKGIWLKQFNPDLTKPGKFHTAAKETVEVPFMNLAKIFYYTEAKSLDSKILRLPYKGNKFAMFIILPNKMDGLNELINKVDLLKLKTELRTMAQAQVQVTIPKFKFDFEAEFTEVLEELGLDEIFQYGNNFPRLIKRVYNSFTRLSVSDIFQKTGIEINEEGSIAYGATEVTIENKFGEKPQFEFNITHPFMFFLEDQETGSILFAGKVVNPQNQNYIPLPEGTKETSALSASDAQSYVSQSLQPTVVYRQQEPIADASRFNFFDLELLHALSDNNANVLISPASIKTSLAMILEGAGGQSANEISSALRLAPGSTASKAAIQTFISNLKSENGATILESANTAFVSNKLKINSSYDKKLQTDYLVKVNSIDFSNPQVASNRVNSWVSNATHGLIPTLVSPDNFADERSILLLNAVYFKGDWLRQFDEQYTNTKCFKTPTKECVHVRMMQSLDTLNYAQLPSIDAQAVVLPYKDNEFGMLILLPGEQNSVQTLTRDIQHIGLKTILARLEPTEVLFELPKFDIDFNTDLVDYLKMLKIRTIFGDKADLSGIVSEVNVKISNIVHKTKLEVNEKGSVAAAATGSVVVPLMGSSMPRVNVNRPFVFIIFKVRTSDIIFAGQLVEPQEVPNSALPARGLQSRFSQAALNDRYYEDDFIQRPLRVRYSFQ